MTFKSLILAGSHDVKSLKVKLRLNEIYSTINGNKYTYVIILDVRTWKGFTSGHLKNALSVPIEVLEEKISILTKYKKQPIIVYCKGGIRSTKAVEILKKYII